MPIPVRSIRLQRRSSRSLDTLSGASGEIFFDSDRNTLRLYTANQADSVILADRVWVEENTFSGDYNNLANRPTQFSGLSGLSFAQGAFINEFSDDGTLSADSDTIVPTQRAIKEYVDASTGAIDLTGLATETYVDDAITGLATETYVDNAVGAIPTITGGTGITVTDGEIATTITQYTDADAQAAFTAGTGISIDSGEISTTITQYTDADAQAAVTATDVGLGNVTNESKATMFTDPTFTGTVTLTDDGTNSVVIDAGNISISNGKLIQFGTSGQSFIQASATRITLGSANASVVAGDSSVILNGITTFLGGSRETTHYISGATGIVVHDITLGGVFAHKTPNTNWTANFTNVPTDTGNTISVALIIFQDATAYMPTAVQIGGAAQSILWQGGLAPTGTANGIDVVSFTLIREFPFGVSVLGSATSYS